MSETVLSTVFAALMAAGAATFGVAVAVAFGRRVAAATVRERRR